MNELRFKDRESTKANIDDVIRNRPLDNCYKIYKTFIKSRNRYFYSHKIEIKNCGKKYIFFNTRRASEEKVYEIQMFANKLKVEIENMIDCGMTNREFDEWYKMGEWKMWLKKQKPE